MADTPLLRRAGAWVGDRLPEPLGSWLLRLVDDSEEQWVDAEGRLLHGRQSTDQPPGGRTMPVTEAIWDTNKCPDGVLWFPTPERKSETP